MRGTDRQQATMFSYLSPERRVPTDHPLRTLRPMVDDALGKLSGLFDAMYAAEGRPSIPPEKLLRALILQLLYSVRSERQLMEQLDYNLLFRWFVGLNADEPVWDPSTFSKNRDRLLAAEIARMFFSHVVGQARGCASQRSSTTAPSPRALPRATGPMSTCVPAATHCRSASNCR